jgi:hypothetical protein
MRLSWRCATLRFRGNVLVRVLRRLIEARAVILDRQLVEILPVQERKSPPIPQNHPASGFIKPSGATDTPL